MKIKSMIISLTLIFYINHSSSQQMDLAIFVDAGDNQGLITAIENANNGTGPDLIFIRPGPGGELTFTFTEAYMGTENALPPITANIGFFPISSLGARVTFERDLDAPQFRLFEVTNNGRLELGVFNIESFNVNGNGGAILANGNSNVTVLGSSFRNNFASGEGGAIHMAGESKLFARGTGRLSGKGPGEFIGNRAGSLGGAISITGNATGNISHHIFADNNASIFGCDINLNSSSNANFGHTLIVENNTFAANCPNVLIENPQGRMLFRYNTFAGMSNAIDTTDTVNLFANLFDLMPSNNKEHTNVDIKAICNDFGTNAITSLGFNISNEASCGLGQATDLPNTDPKTNPIDADYVVSLREDSPAIDAGSFEMQENTEGFDSLPCGYVDSRGLGRPQDANGDGVFECDIGTYEVQGGDNLTNAQSGLFYDIDRSGEGIILEMLSAESALLSMFTYNPNKTDLMWFIAVGTVVGNSIVFDELTITDGGVFGSNFNPDNIVRTSVGGLSLIFSDCESTKKPGRLIFEANHEYAEILENLLVKNNRLSRLLECNQNQISTKTGRSGSFYDANRSGEGIFVQVLDDDRAVIIFYTYTPDGKQFWAISSSVQIDGNTLTANMVYPASTTGFGSQFNPSEVDLQTWGSLTLEYQTDCNQLTMIYDSTVSGFGNGVLNYQRLTQPAGTTCDL